MVQKLLLIKSDIKNEEYLKKILQEHGFSVSTIPLDSLLLKSGESIKEIDKPILTVREIEMDLNRMEVRVDGTKIELTSLEFKLLQYMMNNPDVVLTREQLLSRVWGFNTEVESRAVDVIMGYLRRKLHDVWPEEFIVSYRGFGYMLKELP